MTRQLSNRRPRLADRAADERGFSLVELITVLMIFGIVGLGLTAAAVSTLRTGHRVDVMTTDQGSARTAVSVMTRDLRTAAPVRPVEAPAIRVAASDRIEFTGFLGSSTRPELVRIYVADGRVVEDTIAPNSGTFESGTLAWDEADAEVRLLTSFYANRDDEPLFRYFTADGAELDPGDGVLTAVQARQVRQIEILLAVSGDQIDRVGRYVVTSRVRLPNAEIGAQP